MNELGFVNPDVLEIPLPPGSVYYWSPEMNGSFPLLVLVLKGKLLLVFLEHQVFASAESRTEQRVAEIRDITFATKVSYLAFPLFSPSSSIPPRSIPTRPAGASLRSDELSGKPSVLCVGPGDEGF